MWGSCVGTSEERKATDMELEKQMFLSQYLLESVETLGPREEFWQILLGPSLSAHLVDPIELCGDSSLLGASPPLTLFRQLVKVLVAQLCPTLCDPMDCSSPVSSVHRIL